MTRRITLLVVSLIVLAGCRLDVTVSVEMDPDGTGTVTLVANADAELVAQVPDLVDDLRLDDAEANGWLVEGPTQLDGGGLTIKLSHPFASKDELANVLNSIGPPLAQMAAARNTENEQTTNAINGELGLPNGFESFADAELLQSVGGMPFADEFTATGATPADAFSFTFRVALPGELISAETGTEVDDGGIEWQAPLDGSSVNLYTATVQRPAGSDGAWAGPLSTAAFVALIGWVVVAGGFITFVAVARRRKQTRRERALRQLERR